MECPKNANILQKRWQDRGINRLVLDHSSSFLFLDWLLENSTYKHSKVHVVRKTSYKSVYKVNIYTVRRSILDKNCISFVSTDGKQFSSVGMM